MAATTTTSKPYYQEYTRESDGEFCATDAYCWAVLDRQVRTREVASEAGINTFIEHPDKGDPPSWWVITTPNAGYIPTAPIGIRHIQAKADGRFGLDDRTLHPQMYVKGFEYICCIPIRDQSRHMLWWTPTLDDCPMVPNSPFSVIIRVLKPELLKGYKDLRDKYVGLIGKREGRDRSPLVGLLVTAMCQALDRLRSFGMTYKEILLAVAEFQRAVLDIHAWIDFVDVYQPRLFPGPNGVVKFEANQNLMGAITEKVQVAQQLHSMGIPVWLIRPSFRILPTMNVNVQSTQIHCDKIVLNHFKNGMGELDPYPVLATGPPSTELYRWTQRIGCAIMDLQDVTAIGRQDFIEGKASIGGVRDAYSIPVPSASALSSAGKVGPSAYLLPSSVGQQHSSSSKVLLSVASQQLSRRSSVPSIQPVMPNPTRHGGPGPSKRPRIAEVNVADVDSPFMPVPVPTWANALRNLDTDRRRLKRHPGDVVNIGYKYPKPDIFLNSKNRALYTATWLAVRAHHAYTLATGTELPPPITAQQWRNFLLRILPFLDAEDIDHAADQDDIASVPLPPLPATKGKQKKAGGSSRKKNVKKSNSYLDDIPLRDSLIDRVVFYDTTIQLGTTQELEQALTPEVTQEILWELCHMSFRFELLSLDALLADTLYRGRGAITQAEAARSRSEQLLRVFPMSGDTLGSFMINEIPNRDLGLTSFDLEERNRHLVALGNLMCPWKGCPDSIRDASQLPIEAHVQALEDACASFYCQSFFDNFGRAPIIPCRLPTRSLARPEPVTFADSVTSAQPSS